MPLRKMQKASTMTSTRKLAPWPRRRAIRMPGHGPSEYFATPPRRAGRRQRKRVRPRRGWDGYDDEINEDRVVVPLAVGLRAARGAGRGAASSTLRRWWTATWPPSCATPRTTAPPCSPPSPPAPTPWKMWSAPPAPSSDSPTPPSPARAAPVPRNAAVPRHGARALAQAGALARGRRREQLPH